ncbi:MAG TPA: DoxX family protein [Burkholderiales bacterium]|nr:DoxX family protein [Burkholderiales bacterium]
MKNLAHVLGWLEAGAHALDLAIRLYVAQVFFRSGLLKIGNWDGTLYLFENEYRVPFLPPEAAAWLGTFAELFFPVFLALGLAARFAAAALFVFNLVAVVSFWHVLSGNQAALNSHWYWGVLLAVTLLHGPGRLSLDHWIWNRLVLTGSAASAR